MSGPEAHCQPRILFERTPGIEHFVDHHDTSFYILNNSHSPTSLRLSRLADTTPLPASWQDTQEYFRAADNEKIEEVELFRDYAAVFVKRSGLSQMDFFKFESGERMTVDTGEEIGTLTAGSNADFNSHVVRFNMSGPFTIDSHYEFDMQREVLLSKWERHPVGLPRHRFLTERKEVEGRNGTRIPVTLIRKKDVQLHGRNPVSLRAYGAYGLPIEPAFRLDILPLLQRGFVVALAHVRGGSELGRQWYDDGRLMRKENTFEDFIAVAEWLIGEGYSSDPLMSATGFSAGGLLLGTVLNRRPDLFRAMVLRAPFLDPLTTMLTPDSPLASVEREEWGDPMNDSAAYDYIAKYAPYDIIPVDGKFNTSVLVTISKEDQRVSPWQVLKWVARMRGRNLGVYGVGEGGGLEGLERRNLVLRMRSGHGHDVADQGVKMEDAAVECAFLVKELGL
ncbi:hypothetical protein HDV00_005541 [Rhizophlyctis rosea]|nr:hypothetical protein HDV00_005541 [Rhizophlyctis rosea]